jgi:HAD superfamily hydrolase (TIGR01509 family)
VPFARVRPLIGKGGDKVLAELVGLDEESAGGKAISDTRKALFKRDYVPTLRQTPGANRLIRWMLDAQLRVVVATSAKEDELRDLLAVCDGLALLGDATSSDDAERSKPDPDIIVAALQKSELPADRLLMLGDTPYDIEAASRAGVSTVALRCGGWPDERLGGAIAIYDHPDHLLEQITRSPFNV